MIPAPAPRNDQTFNNESRPRLRLTNDVAMSDEQQRHYDEQGFVVVPGVVNDFECAVLERLALPFADDDYSVVLNIHRRSEVFGDMMRDPVVVRMVEKVQRSRIDGLNSQYLFKRPSTRYGRQSWTPHQDNSYPKAKHGSYIIVHLSLEDSDPSNGGLVFWPGSHREEILPFAHNKSWREEADAQGITHPGQTVQVPEQYKATDMFLPKGSLCFMHGNLIHSSYPNLSPSRTRPQYSMAYLNQGEAFDPGKTSIKARFDLYK